MKVELTRRGTLVIGPETPIEEYALARWATDYETELPEGLLIIADSDVDLIAAAEADEEESNRAVEALGNGPDNG